jgi:hypothetical protein
MNENNYFRLDVRDGKGTFHVYSEGGITDIRFRYGAAGSNGPKGHEVLIFTEGDHLLLERTLDDGNGKVWDMLSKMDQYLNELTGSNAPIPETLKDVLRRRGRSRRKCSDPA